MPKKLSLRVVFFMLVVSVLATVLGFSWEYHDRKQTEYQRLESQIVQTLNGLSNSLIAPMWGYDVETIRLIVDSEINHDFISSISLFDTVNGSLVYRHVDDEKEKMNGFLHEREVNIVRGGVVIGKILVCASDKKLRHEIHSWALSFLLKFMFSITICIISLRFLIDRYIVRQVKDMVSMLYSSAPADIENNEAMMRMGQLYSNEVQGLLSELISFRQHEAEFKKKMFSAEKMDAVGRLAGGVAHDLNNVLGGIMGATQIVQKLVKGDAEAERFLAMILEAATSGADLTRNLLSFSRIQEMDFSQVELVALCTKAIDMYKQTSRAGSTVLFENHAKEAFVSGDRTRLKMMLLNLMINADDAMSHAGVIRVSVARHPLNNNVFRISVRDAGHGMSEEVRSKIFEPFYTTKGDGEGTGLGLSLVYSIVEMHQGQISVESANANGTVFYIDLPATGGNVMFDDTSGQKAAGQKAAGQDTAALTARSTVLVIDDDPIIRAVLSQYITDMGHDVFACSSCGEGISKLENHALPVVVVLDMIMPGISGIECLRHIRKHFPALPVLVCSGYASDKDLQALAELGGQIDLMKPFTRQQFEEALKSVLEQC